MAKREPITGMLRAQVFERDGFRCMKCGHGKRWGLQIHHILPVVYGGTNTAFNLITLCEDCHRDAPNDPIAFFEYCARHISPELPRSQEITKLMCMIVLNRLGILTTDNSENEQKFAVINQTVSHAYDLLWTSLLSNRMKEFSELMDLAVPPRQMDLCEQSRSDAIEAQE